MLKKRTLLKLNPHFERLTPSTKLNPTYFLANYQTPPIYTMVLEKPSTP